MEIEYLDKAIDKAWQYQLLTYPNPAVGATVVKDNKILSIEAHKKAGAPHAEVLALKEAFLQFYPDSKIKTLESSSDIHSFLIKNHNNIFKDCQIYVTLEPCNHTGRTPSCANLIKELGLQKVFIGTLDPNKTASGGVSTLKESGIEVELLHSKKSDSLLYPFVKWQKDRFLFFKLAIRMDGSFSGGYITTQDSLNWVHNIRTKIDMMVIGGNTVRVDRPKLDSRFSISKKAPNIMIYSTKQDFDKTIPCFNISNRDVIISDNFDIINDKNFVMIEGGVSLYRHLFDSLDYLVLFVSHKFEVDNIIDIAKYLNVKIVYSYFINQYDEIIFTRPLNQD